MEQTIDSSIDNIRSTQAAVNNDIDALNDTCERLQEENKKLNDKIDDMEDNLDYTENHSRRNQLLIHRIPWPQGKETWDDCEVKIKIMFRNKLNITSDLHVEGAHRVGTAIIVKFLSFKGRELVMSQCHVLRGSSPPLSIRPDVSDNVGSKITGLVSLKQTYRD